MGLSNEERLTGLFYDINHMVTLADDIKERHQSDHDYPKKLIGFIDQLWPAFLGQSRNGAHWILGSSATNEVTWYTMSPWGVAINHHCYGLTAEEQEQPKEDFNAFEGFLDLSGLLGNAGGSYRKVHEIFAYSEQAVYHLRRYEDELSKDLTGLSKLISAIQGECFDLFQREETYARAYILSLLTKMIYGPHYPYQKDKWDPLTKHLVEANIHHNLSRMMQPRDGNIKELAALHVKLHQAEKAGKLTLMLRTEAMLQLVGRRYHYDHVFAKMCALFKKSVTPQDLKKLKTLFEKCKKEHEDDEKESREDFKKDRPSPLSIYSLSLE